MSCPKPKIPWERVLEWCRTSVRMRTFCSLLILCYSPGLSISCSPVLVVLKITVALLGCSNCRLSVQRGVCFRHTFPTPSPTSGSPQISLDEVPPQLALQGHLKAWHRALQAALSLLISIFRARGIYSFFWYFFSRYMPELIAKNNSPISNRLVNLITDTTLPVVADRSRTETFTNYSLMITCIGKQSRETYANMPLYM